ncbi:MAG: hypothetical protein ABW056_12560, partial [Thermoanaerobaculia bacterium]
SRRSRPRASDRKGRHESDQPNAFQPARGQVSEAAHNWREVWHYRQELLPKGVGYNQVDIEFITKKGYGVNVMQRDPVALATAEVASAASKP